MPRGYLRIWLRYRVLRYFNMTSHSDHAIRGRSPGPFVDKAPLRAIDIVAHASLQHFRHEWWNIRAIETNLECGNLRTVFIIAVSLKL